MHQLASRLRSADRERSALVSSTVLQRLAARLIELGSAEVPGPHARSPDRPPGALATSVVRLGQDDLAATVGATREAVAKALRLLRDQHLVRAGVRLVEILDPEPLALLASGCRSPGTEKDRPRGTHRRV